MTDPSGAVFPGVTVTLINQGTNVTRASVTNDAGIYRFDAVDLGIYNVAVKADGFKEAAQTGISVQANRIATLDFTLELGTGAVTVEVSAAVMDALQTSDAARGGNFETRRINQLPLAGLDSIALTLLLPGVQNADTTQFSNGTFNLSVNGQRARSNNFMIDGVENNDISVAGPAFTITNPDAVQEVAVQTSQFSAEFGRAGGAVINQVTKSGTNQYHGTAAWLFRSNAFDATDNLERITQKAGQTIPGRLVRNIPSFTFGGPVVIPGWYDGRDKTFFFAGVQWDRQYSLATSSDRTIPTDAGIATLQTLAGSCPNVALYLQAIGSMRGNPGTLSPISIAAPSATGTCTGTNRAGMTVDYGLTTQIASQSALDSNHTIRIDHIPSTKQTMSFRWLYDDNVSAPFFNNMNGFDRAFNGKTMTGSFTDAYVLRNNWTNEFRFNYGRIGFNFPSLAADSFSANLANYAILGVTGFGVATNIPQFRFANNWQYQDTMTWLQGRHQMRFGADFLRQLAKQRPPFNERGSFSYRASTGATALANFIDDFGGNGGALARVFGDPVYYPNLFRQAYFFQDDWRVHSSLTLNLGLRYENFGQPANVFQVPAFTNYSVTDFAAPNQVKPDNNNFAPVVGFAWNPGFGNGLLAKIFGDKKTVWRGGFQVTYDTWFNNLLSNIAGSSPNTLGGQINSTASGTSRGLANFSSQFATIQPTPATALSPQNSLLDPNLRNPYVMRWSLGMQRELPQNLLVDVSYVATAGRKLFQTLDMNPIVGPGTTRFMPLVGARTIRANTGNSNYHSLQVNVRRRFGMTPVGGLQVEGAWTYSHGIDNVSEVFSTTSTGSSFESLPSVLGTGRRIDRAASDFDRRHRLVLGYLWDIRGPKTGLWSYFIGGWSVGGISQFITGAPFTVGNGTDRNSDGQAAPDRPDIGNPNAPINSRGQIIRNTPPATNPVQCVNWSPTGFINPEAGTCVTTADVFWVQGAGLPTANTMGRNSLRAPGVIVTDLNIQKRFRVSERFDLRYRAELFNAFNHQNSQLPSTVWTVSGTAAGSFLNFSKTEALGRSIRMGLRLEF